MLFKHLLISLIFFISCDTGKLNLLGSMPNDLKEVSAAEMTSKSNLIWVIEDAGNDNHLYGLDEKGTIKKDIAILNSENIDWEDLTSDSEGNIYIGDFGNNSEKREKLTIYKVTNPDNAGKKASSERIDFELPDHLKSKDFESFFLLDGYFYIFSKSNKTSDLIKVENKIGSQKAELITDFNLDGKHNKITSADISDDGETVVLLNHDKLWMLTDFKPDAFFKGTIKELKFDHDTQKEGICFKNDGTVYLTDERNHSEGGNIYSFNLD